MSTLALNWLFARLQERSTWVGIIGFVGSLGVHVHPDLAQPIATAGVALIGVLMAVTKDTKPS